MEPQPLGVRDLLELGRQVRELADRLTAAEAMTPLAYEHLSAAALHLKDAGTALRTARAGGPRVQPLTPTRRM